ncbi:MAG TPA: creatininase family protein [Polyangiaceae bacterium]|nr:creatininase family protein [Polyangiaceae bacterium]
MTVRLADLTTEEARAAVASPPTALLVPVGSVEPHGPHLPLGTDTIISETSATRACAVLAQRGVRAFVAPSIAYGVTDFAGGFAGAVSIAPSALTAYLHGVATALLAGGWSHVCFVSNHLEPAHDEAVRAAARSAGASVASPLTRRWARTLSDEFKRGDCHAGRYETSLVLAAGAPVKDEHKSLPALGVSLSDAIRAGKGRFRDIGMDRAYTGAPADATREEGEDLYARLVEMIVTEVTEALRA